MFDTGWQPPPFTVATEEASLHVDFKIVYTSNPEVIISKTRLLVATFNRSTVPPLIISHLTVLCWQQVRKEYIARCAQTCPVLRVTVAKNLLTAPGCPWVSFLLSLSVVSQDTISVGIQRNVLEGSQILATPQTIAFAASTRH